MNQINQGNPSEIDGDLDMKNYRIVNLQQSGESRSDAATVGIVSDWVGSLNNVKVNWSGGTMTGNLNMGQYMLEQSSNPGDDDDDVINKGYFNNIVQETNPYDLGRHIVFPHADRTSTYHSAGSIKNIDLDSDKVFEIFNGKVHGNNLMTPGRLNARKLNLPKNEKAITMLNSEHNIYPESPNV